MFSASAIPAVHFAASPIGPSAPAVIGATVQAAPLAVAKPVVAAPPVISHFGVINDDGVFILEGVVTETGASVRGLKVTIGGILARYHLTATVLADGTFCESMVIPRGGVSGTATAQTLGNNGLVSNLAMTCII